MAHRVRKLEFVNQRDGVSVRALGTSARGTKFIIRSVEISTKGVSKTEIADLRRGAVIELMVGQSRTVPSSVSEPTGGR